MDLSAEVDRLYQLPLAEFTEARNALARRLKAEQGVDAATHIRTLDKPNVTAWVINQLYWRHRAEFTALLLAGDAVRLAQQQRLGGLEVDLGPPTRARHEAIDALLALAADLLREAGHQPGPDLRQRLQTSLDALAAYGTGDAAPRAGRLTADVQPPGFGALAALLPAGGPSSTPAPAAPAARNRGLTVVARREREKAQAALAQAENALAAAQEEARRCETAAASADQRWQEARRALADAQKVVDEATVREQAARGERDERKRDAARAALTVRDAERAVDKASRAVKE